MSSSSASSASGAEAIAQDHTKNNSKKTKEKWLCDICKEISFDTYEEACRHEEECTAAATSECLAEIGGRIASAFAGPAPVDRSESSCPPMPSSPPPHLSSSGAAASAAAGPATDTSSPCMVPDENATSNVDDSRTTKAEAGAEVEAKVEPEDKSKLAQKVMYLCDFCKVAQFKSYDEACQHEDSCRLRQQCRLQGTTTSSSTETDADTKNSACTDGGSRCAGRYDATIAGIRTSINASSHHKSDATGTGTPSPKALAAVFTFSRPTPSTTNRSNSNSSSSSGGAGTGGATERKRGAYAAVGVGDKKASPGTALLREHKAAEASAKFAAERKRKRDEERERKRKREAAAAAAAAVGSVNGNEISGAVIGIFARPKKRPGESSVDTNVIDLVEAESAKNESTPKRRERMALRPAGEEPFTTSKMDQPSFPLAPRFPNPTHLIGGDDSVMLVAQPVCGGNGKNDSLTIAMTSESSVFVSTGQMDVAAKAIVTSARYQQAGGDKRAANCVGSGGCANQRSEKTDASSKELPLLYTADQLRSASTAPIATMKGYMHADEDLARIIASVISPPPVSSGDGAEPSNELWSAKYGICHVPGDVCGDANKESAQALVTFIDGWKAHRAEFVKKMEEKRKSLGSRKRRKTKKGGIGRNYYEDDIWCSTDDEDLGLCNIFLLNGPHGTGKSALVHAAALQTGCVLLEINTTEKRGRSALKRAIEECTQSHSSLALLKRRTTPSSGDFGGAPVPNSGVDPPSDLCDEADSEYGDDTDNEEADEVAADRGRLAIILIDEGKFRFQEETIATCRVN